MGWRVCALLRSGAEVFIMLSSFHIYFCAPRHHNMSKPNELPVRTNVAILGCLELAEDCPLLTDLVRKLRKRGTFSRRFFYVGA